MQGPVCETKVKLILKLLKSFMTLWFYLICLFAPVMFNYSPYIIHFKLYESV